MKKIILLLMPFIFLACKQEMKQDAQTSNVIVSKTVDINDNPQRIVSVSPQITELIFVLQEDKRLIARTDYCLSPKEALTKESIGGINNANIEKIISLKPDLVITSSIFTRQMFQSLEDAGISVISFKESNTVEGMYEVIESLGSILKTEEKAQKIILSCKEKLKEIRSKQTSDKRPKIYYVVGYGKGGDFSAGRNTYIDEIITLAGGENIAKESKNWSFSLENLFASQPDYIFIRKEDKENFVKTYPYTDLRAVKEGRVYAIESSLMDIQTPKSIDAIGFISNIINPQ